jgi:hypothetical protein
VFLISAKCIQINSLSEQLGVEIGDLSAFIDGSCTGVLEFEFRTNEDLTTFSDLISEVKKNLVKN